MLIDRVAKHRYPSFMEGYSSYNQIIIVEEDLAKTTFICLRAIGTYKWLVMPFNMKNMGATYQRVMNAIFYDFIGKFMEIYLDDIVVNFGDDDSHLTNLL